MLLISLQDVPVVAVDAHAAGAVSGRAAKGHIYEVAIESLGHVEISVRVVRLVAREVPREVAVLKVGLRVIQIGLFASRSSAIACRFGAGAARRGPPKMLLPEQWLQR